MTMEEKIEQIRAETNPGANTCDRIADALKGLLNLIEGGTSSIQVGSVVTGAPGTAAKVENIGTAQDVVLNFTIPAGNPGDPGKPASVAVTETITGAPGTAARIENTGTAQDGRLKFTIPQGKKGDPGTGGSGGPVLPSVGMSISEELDLPENKHINVSIGAVSLEVPEAVEVCLVLLRRGRKRCSINPSKDKKSHGWYVPADGQEYLPTGRRIRSKFKAENGVLTHLSGNTEITVSELLADWTQDFLIWRKGYKKKAIFPKEDQYQRASANFGLAVGVRMATGETITGPITRFEIRISREKINTELWQTFQRVLIK